MVSFVFGDVHGRSDKLDQIIQQAIAKYGEVDFYTLGDLIDRGPDSKGVLDLCVEHKVHGIIGNHELWFLGALFGSQPIEDYILAPIMGSLETLYTWDVDPNSTPSERTEQLQAAVSQDHKAWLSSSLRLVRVLQAGGRNWYMIHAGVDKRLADKVHAIAGPVYDDMTMLNLLTTHQREAILWTSPDLKNMYRFPGGGVQILGHKPIPAPRVEPHFVALDTGCGTCPPFRLSGMAILPDGTLKFLTV